MLVLKTEFLIKVLGKALEEKSQELQDFYVRFYDQLDVYENQKKLYELREEVADLQWCVTMLELKGAQCVT